MEIEIKEYIDIKGVSVFAEWFRKLNPPAAYKVTESLYKMKLGNFSNLKSVGAGVFE